MNIEFGSRVVDKNGVELGTVDYVIRNSWTGEISKFRIRREQPNNDLFISVENAQEVDQSKIKLNVPYKQLENMEK
jgi:sporulation protein YlmC with PRC-barrel domain